MELRLSFGLTNRKGIKRERNRQGKKLRDKEI
jgi:hypothetical protein